MSTAPSINPAILTSDFEDFKAQLAKVEPFFEHVHIDIMDGQFVSNTSFAERAELLQLATKLKFELHLMVNHPVEEMKQWTKVNNVFRVLFHLEALDSPEDCIEFAKTHSWQKGLVLNPDTPLYRAESYFPEIDVLQFMTVYPGAQGSPFVTGSEEKIRAFTRIEKRPLCAVDGAVSPQTIGLLRSSGVEIFNVGSALMKASHFEKAYTELQKKL
jgi:ribulose-phosphate 3-epimerase